MAHPNEELVRRGYEAFATGDMETLRELLDPEIVWHFPGRSVLAGDHRGPDAVLGPLPGPVRVAGRRCRVHPGRARGFGARPPASPRGHVDAWFIASQ